MAEGILRSLVAARRGIRVGSAGTAEIDGMPASPLARQVSAEHGVDISGHRSRGLAGRLATGWDLVLGMTREHVDHVERTAPTYRGRVFLLSEFADGSDVDVPDPIGGPREEYEEVYETIERYLEAALPRITSMAGEAK